MKARLAVAGAAVVALTLALGALAMPSERRSAARPFSVSGSVSGLLPGVATPFRVTVRNPHRFAIRVTSLRASTTGGAVGCGPGNLRVQPLRRSIVVPARARRRATLVATLSGTAPEACAHVTFGLRYNGRAVKR